MYNGLTEKAVLDMHCYELDSRIVMTILEV